MFALLLLAALIGGAVARLLPISGRDGTEPSAPLPALSGSAANLPALVRKAAPAVVNIAVLQPSPAEQNPLLRDPFFRQYFGVSDVALQPVISAGSGVIVDAARGLVVTNFHVVRNARAIEVGLKDGRHVAAYPVALAPNLDLAVLRISAKGLSALQLGDSGKLVVGDTVVAIGNPFGLGQTVTAGIVSATNRPLGPDDPRRFIQTDAPINPGNSGGPLIGLDGKIAGINSALFSPSEGQGSVGIGFAIPANIVRGVVAKAEK
ncbi:MAG TPA: trypsin-like peptidase domain-containing protein [Sphingomicrobium sp.]|nr:trypsin-like peptidase domain-containing protein [Sphingomicrobium sp.]